MRRERAGNSFQTTALLNEAWLQLVDVKESWEWQDRSHFFAMSARLMRRILVDVRPAVGLRHGGAADCWRICSQASISQTRYPTCNPTEDVRRSLDDALNALEKIDP